MVQKSLVGKCPYSGQLRLSIRPTKQLHVEGVVLGTRRYNMKSLIPADTSYIMVDGVRNSCGHISSDPTTSFIRDGLMCRVHTR